LYIDKQLDFEIIVGYWLKILVTEVSLQIFISTVLSNGPGLPHFRGFTTRCIR